jgi:hypothetical protein
MKYQPRLDLPEAHLLAEKLGLRWERFLSEYTDPRWPGTESFLIRQDNDVCLFFKPSGDHKQSLCVIHPFKPACCRNWQSGLDKPECRHGLQSIWGLNVDSSGQVSGEPGKLAELNQFIQRENQSQNSLCEESF